LLLDRVDQSRTKLLARAVHRQFGFAIAAPHDGMARAAFLRLERAALGGKPFLELFAVHEM
jgi:hypothetical protein